MANRTLRVGNGAGFWGDNLDAPFLLASAGQLDVLTLEYLAELTLAILSHLRSKDPEAGYVADFPELLERLSPLLKEQAGLRVVTNAGGLNARACARRCAEVLEAAGQGGEPLGVVTGDDLLGSIPAWIRENVDLAHMETGAPISTVADRLVSANAYLGAEPIAKALSGGARIVLTGRVADASLTLGPACAHFGWAWNDWDRLAGGSAAGHVIECGAQATGGLWHRWDEIPNLENIGYPIAEIDRDGASVITKPDGSGGLVSVGTVAEQIVYEIDDPACYRTPDVDVDLTSISLTEVGPNRVALQGATGRPPSDRLKVAAVYRDGWTASGLLAVVGRGAEAKAHASGWIVLERVRRAGFELADSLVECLGAGSVVPGVLGVESPPFEVMLRVSVRDPNRKAVERFCREFAPLVTSGPSGIAGYASGRPSARPAFGYWPTLVPRHLVEARTEVGPVSDWLRRTQ
ncbi:acyclic terpene utilization AtuA family protein [Singulisphaera sp. Ch08]|uniref:Acyclic terpene utilization AtuA family protein n=1 Tax=Singulisphaera sp. Ch08 TaxID=3120278 RepID=A0AAU7CR63_9BACT